MKVQLGFAALLLSCGIATSAQAFPIAPAGTECLPVMVSANGPVVATYQGNSAGYSNDLYLMLDGAGNPGDDGILANDLFIFNNHATPVGTQMNLGNFTAGTELIFRLHVNNTGYNFLTGPGTRNPDGKCHARVLGNWQPNETLVSFEDLFNTPEGANGYNDLSFSFTNTNPCASNNAPILDLHSDPNGVQVRCGQAVTVFSGTTVDFDVLTFDPDGDLVTLDVSGGLPPGALTSPPVPTTAPLLHFAWTPTNADGGPHLIKFFATDGCITVTCPIEIDVVTNRPPDCSGATATVLSLWPPNHQMSPVTITGITDPDGDPVSVTVTGITQDEAVNTSGDGNTCPDAIIEDSGNASIRVERSGLGNGRVYQISFTADDGRGGVCTGTASVCVAHDKGGSSQCIDDGQDYVSTQECTDSADQSGGTVRTTDMQVRTGESNSSLRTIQYILPSEADVQISAFDVLGRKVATLEASRQGAGEHQVSWDTSSLHGGMYFLLLQAGDVTVKRSVVVTR